MYTMFYILAYVCVYVYIYIYIHMYMYIISLGAGRSAAARRPRGRPPAAVGALRRRGPDPRGLQALH